MAPRERGSIFIPEQPPIPEGSIVRAFRWHFGMDQREMAAICSVSTQRFSQYEKAPKLPVTRLEKIAEHFGLTLYQMQNIPIGILKRWVLDGPRITQVYETDIDPDIKAIRINTPTIESGDQLTQRTINVTGELQLRSVLGLVTLRIIQGELILSPGNAVFLKNDK